MRIKVKYCTIEEVSYAKNEKGKEDKSKREVTLQMNMEDFYDMLDSVKPKLLVNYLVMRNVKTLLGDGNNN